MFEAATNRDNRCRAYRGPRPDGGRLNRIVGVIAAQRQRTETEVVFAGIVVTSRIGLRVDEATCEFRKPQPPFGGPVPVIDAPPHTSIIAAPSKRRWER